MDKIKPKRGAKNLFTGTQTFLCYKKEKRSSKQSEFTEF